MRILVLSDSHGSRMNVERAINSQPNAEVVIHLGDGRRDYDEQQILQRGKLFVAVKGNNDFGSPLSYDETRTFDSKKFFMTHGHRYNVKYTVDNLINVAEENDIDVVLYGHTHIPKIEFFNGKYYVCPGSIGGWEPTYATIDITKAGIVCNIVKLR